MDHHQNVAFVTPDISSSTSLITTPSIVKTFQFSDGDVGSTTINQATTADILTIDTKTNDDRDEACGDDVVSSTSAGVPLEATTVLTELPGTDVEADIELEADAESLADDDSDDDVEHLELFRFSRGGLSLEIDLTSLKENSFRPRALSDMPIEEEFSVGLENGGDSSGDEEEPFMSEDCCIVNFEEYCRIKYPPDFLIGSRVPRFSPAPGTIEENEVSSSTATFPLPFSADNTIAPNILKAPQKLLGVESRLSALLADLERRINRQRFIADPRSVCRKGGGRSGEYYEKDDKFFDDSEAYEVLGAEEISAYDQSYPSSEGSQSGDEDWDDNGFDYYIKPSNFTFDNNPDNDEVDLAESVLPDGSTIGDSEASSVHSDREGKGTLSNQGWVKCKAWRSLEDQCPNDMKEALIDLEKTLEPLGNSRGLYVEKKEILTHIFETSKEVFKSSYPVIPWDCKTMHGFEQLLEPSILSSNKEITDPQRSNTENEINGNTNEGSKIEVTETTTIQHLVGEPIPSVSVTPMTDENQGEFIVAAAIKEFNNDVKNDCFVGGDSTVGENAKEIAEKTEVKTAKRKKLSKKKSYTPGDLVSVEWKHHYLFLDCLAKMTSVMNPKLLEGWFSGRLIFHNQLVYDELEDKLVEYITKQSSLFRKKGSYFFKNLKKAMDVYLHSLETISFNLANNDNNNSTTGSEQQSTASTIPTPNVGTNIIELQKKQSQSQGPILPDPPDSPFFPVAIELLNWAIVYNCRRNELKLTRLAAQDCFPSTFAAYATDKLNACIAMRRGELNESKKDRICIRVKFFEETMKRFKQHFNVPTLYERGGKRKEIPKFVHPCRCIGLRDTQAAKQTPLLKRQSIVGEQQQSAPPSTVVANGNSTIAPSEDTILFYSNTNLPDNANGLGSTESSTAERGGAGSKRKRKAEKAEGSIETEKKKRKKEARASNSGQRTLSSTGGFIIDSVPSPKNGLLNHIKIGEINVALMEHGQPMKSDGMDRNYCSEICSSGSTKYLLNQDITAPQDASPSKSLQQQQPRNSPFTSPPPAIIDLTDDNLQWSNDITPRIAGRLSLGEEKSSGSINLSTICSYPNLIQNTLRDTNDSAEQNRTIGIPIHTERRGGQYVNDLVRHLVAVNCSAQGNPISQQLHLIPQQQASAFQHCQQATVPAVEYLLAMQTAADLQRIMKTSPSASSNMSS